MTLLKPTGIMMVTVQVHNFDAAVVWYRDVLGLEVQYLEPNEFCMLGLADRTGTALALATDHPDPVGITT